MAKKAITAEEMLVIEKKAEKAGISPLLLMENAGRAVAEVVLDMKPKRVRVLCGIGNNGGDGFVATRHLLAAGVDTRAYLLGVVQKIHKREALTNLKILQKTGKNTVVCLTSKEYVLRVKKDLQKADIIVDAILGTGVSGELREPISTATRLVNSIRSPVVAVDLPTGVDPTTGEVVKDAVKATKTVSFHATKQGLLNAKEFSGEIIVASLGIPMSLLKKSL